MANLPLAATPAQGQQREGDEDPYRNSQDLNRLRSVHLDRKLSSTARVPKRSTIVESPTGKIAHASDVNNAHRPHEVQPSARVPVGQSAQHGTARLQKAPPLQPPQQQQQQQRSLPSPGSIDTNLQSQVIRPAFARANTIVKIVDESGPSSPVGGNADETMVGGIEDGITLADIPQLVEAAQAREQRRSLPSQNSIPYIAELNPLQLAIVKHCAVSVLARSPLRNEFDLDEILELVETKKSSFWNKLFKPGNDKKNVKKKGVLSIYKDRPYADCQNHRSVRSATGTTCRARGRRLSPRCFACYSAHSKFRR